MSREIAIRVPSEIGAWVRRQPGSSTEAVMALAKGAWERRQDIVVHDPGPGEGRLKFRVSPRVLQFVRGATHSRDATAAIRKLLVWGYQGQAHPASPSYSRPLLSPPSAPAGQESARSLPSARRGMAQSLLISDGRTIRFDGTGHPILGNAALALRESPTLARYPAPDATAFEVPAPVSRVVEAIPIPFLAIGIPVVFLVGGYVLLKWFAGLTTAAKAVAGVAAAAKAAPTVAAWAPQAAAGLGALFL